MSSALRYFLAFVIPLIGALALTPVVGLVAGRAGMLSHPRQDRFPSMATPYLGGLAIAGGLLLSVLLVPGEPAQVVVVVLGALAMCIVGLLDDIREGLGAWPRLVLEAAAGVALWTVGIRAGIFHVEMLDFALTVLWVVAVTNAVNLLDNMDGVAAGVVAVAAVGMAGLAAQQDEYLVASLGLAVAGGCVGFLRYNFPPAKIFMGDAGALMLGFLLAALGLKLDLIGPGTVARAVIPVLAIGVPLFDMVLVIVSRVRAGVPIYQGSTDHSAHRLSAHGLGGGRIALVAYAAQAACSVGAYLLVDSAGGTTVVSLVCAVLVAMVLLGVFLRMRVAGEDLPTSAQRPAPAKRRRDRLLQWL